MTHDYDISWPRFQLWGLWVRHTGQEIVVKGIDQSHVFLIMVQGMLKPHITFSCPEKWCGLVILNISVHDRLDIYIYIYMLIHFAALIVFLPFLAPNHATTDSHDAEKKGPNKQPYDCCRNHDSHIHSATQHVQSSCCYVLLRIWGRAAPGPPSHAHQDEAEQL